ncbi:hypothetical protein PHLCEN_2v5578 [Hermanssonia centrifuga]|uniref:Amidohydrolase-related domain-containing protein n=1 Tax=Hermanssonia centrifuga TaxID=98765 RepID=A0A2R6P1Y3_9APHY|nr:hypothetical protein PHLCEN_2v5578 [Hermanssonia centrifuga]
MEWLNEYAFKAEENIDANPSLAKRVYTRLAQRLIENGTGAVLLFGTIEEDTKPSYVEPSAKASLSAAASFVDKCLALSQDLPPHERLVEPVLTPRFVPTCSDKLLEGLGQLSESRQLRVQSHMAEAHDQVAWVMSERGVHDMEVFERSGLLTPRTVQAHCTFLDTPSLAHVAKRGTSVAHCPLSNTYFSAEPFRLREALQGGVKVGLGTDIAGGYAIDIMSSMRHAVAVSRMREGSKISRKPYVSMTSERAEDDIGGALSIDWKEALYMATRGGALALSLHKGSGAFTVGAPFDAQHICLADQHTGLGVGPMDFLTEESNVMDEWVLSAGVLEKWWCLGDVRNRAGMWVQGRKISPVPGLK